MKITHAMLRRMGACSRHREMFRELFPNGAALNHKNLAKAYDRGLDILWLLLSLHTNRDEVNVVFHKWLKTSEDELAKSEQIRFDYKRGLITGGEYGNLLAAAKTITRAKRLEIAFNAFDEMIATGQFLTV